MLTLIGMTSHGCFPSLLSLSLLLTPFSALTLLVDRNASGMSETHCGDLHRLSLGYLTMLQKVQKKAG